MAPLGSDADERFLQSLYERPTKWKAPLDPAFITQAAEAMRATGRLPVDVDAEQFVRDMFSPEKDFRGPKIAMLREAAAPCLTAAERWLLDVPIGFLHTEELNGCAVLAPSGGKVLLIDMGVLLHMTLLGRSIMALTSWGAPEPFCHDHPPVAWFTTIILLAHHASSLDDRHLERITTWNCPTLGEWDRTSAKFAMSVELFVLLHEYGHVALDHLDRHRVVARDDLQVFATNHRQELEADLFGYRHHAQGTNAGAAAIAASTFFRFADVIEHVLHGAPRATRTHPSGRERLQHLKDSEPLAGKAAEAVAQVERVFDKVIEVLPEFRSAR